MKLISYEQEQEIIESIKKGLKLEYALKRSKVDIAEFNEIKKLYSIFLYNKVSILIKEENQEKEESEEMQILLNTTLKNYDYYIEPSSNSKALYINSDSFARKCKDAYEIITNIEQAQAQAIYYYVSKIYDATENKQINHIPATWFLENVEPKNYCKLSRVGKSADVNALNQKDNKKVLVEFVNPDTEENKTRVEKMKNIILLEEGKIN